MSDKVWLLEEDSQDDEDHTPNKIGVFWTLEDAKFAAQELLERKESEWRERERRGFADHLERAERGNLTYASPSVIKARQAEMEARVIQYEWKRWSPDNQLVEGKSYLIDVTITEWEVEGAKLKQEEKAQ